MTSSATVIACPLCLGPISHVHPSDQTNQVVYGYGLDFRIVPRDCNRSSDIVICPDCLFTSRIPDCNHRVPGTIKELVRSEKYLRIFKSYGAEERPARAWLGLAQILQTRSLNPRDLGILCLRGSWVARELGCLETEQELLQRAGDFLEQALRLGLTKADPGMVMYILGEISRRRGEFLRGREMLTFLGNNRGYRYPALLLTVLMEEQDTTPYWSLYAPDHMEAQSSRFKGVFPALRSIPPNKTTFSPDELIEHTEQPIEDDRLKFGTIDEDSEY